MIRRNEVIAVDSSASREAARDRDAPAEAVASAAVADPADPLWWHEPARVAIGRDGTIAGWSASAVGLLGWEEADVVGRPLASLLVGPPGAAERLVRDALAGAPVESAPIACRTKRGPATPVLASATAERRGGAIAGVAFVLACNGLSGWEVAEHRDLDLERMAGIGTWRWSFASGRMTWSRQLLALHGERPEGAPAEPRRLAAAAHPDDRAALQLLLERAALDGGPVAARYRLMRADGALRHVHLHAEVLCDERGVATAMVGFVQDVTALPTVIHGAEEELGPDPAELALARQLGDRQREVLALLAEGLGTAQIAARLYLSESTVKWHVKKILRALHASNRAEAVARYLRATSAAPR